MREKEFNVEHKDGYLWITLPDGVNMDNYVPLEKSIESFLPGNPRDVVIDLGKTKTLYSSGFGMLIRLKKRIEEYNSRSFLVNVSPRLLEALESVGMEKLFPMFDSEKSFRDATGATD